MKIFIYILILLSLGVIVYNFTILNFDNLLAKESSIALIGILAAAIVIVLLSILLTSKAIEKNIEIVNNCDSLVVRYRKMLPLIYIPSRLTRIIDVCAFLLC